MKQKETNLCRKVSVWRCDNTIWPRRTQIPTHLKLLFYTYCVRYMVVAVFSILTDFCENVFNEWMNSSVVLFEDSVCFYGKIVNGFTLTLCVCQWREVCAVDLFGIVLLWCFFFVVLFLFWNTCNEKKYLYLCPFMMNLVTFDLLSFYT